MATTPSTTVSDRYSDEDVAGFYEAGYWRSESFFDDLVTQAEARPDKVFVFDSTTSYTYSELRDQTLKLAAGLRRLGIERGDRVVVHLPNWTEFVLLSTALNRIGAVIVPVMPIYRGSEAAYVVEHSGAVAVVCAEEVKGFSFLDMYREIQAAHPELANLIVARPSGGLTGATSLTDLIVDEDPASLVGELGDDSKPDDPFLIVYTSGTTAKPKGCFHTFNTIRSSSAAIAKSLDYTENDVQFGPSPITHSTGLVTSVILPLITGASSHLMEVWDPKDGIARIQEHGCTVAVTATAFIQMLMAAYDSDQHDLSSMRFWVCAGAPIPGSVVEKATTMLTGGRVLSLYGRSENFLTTMCTALDDPSRSATSDGRALEGAEVKIVDENGAEVPHGTDGDIAYKGPSHMLGYYENGEETEALFTPEGFSRSGDLGHMDDDGFVRVSGRTKDIIIRGGMNISARELEDMLSDHPAISNVVAVAMPDERLGEKVCLFVVPADAAAPPELSELTAYLKERNLATPKLPERVEILNELPVTATGKVQKHILRDQIAAKLSQ